MEGIREPQIEVPNHGRAAGRAPGTRKVPRKYAGLAPNSLSGVPDCQVRKAPVVTPNMHAKVMHEIIMPTINGMAKEGNPFTGFLYAGLMIDSHGDPRTVEFNCRLGDPETQPIMMRLKSDLFDVLMHATEGTLDQVEQRGGQVLVRFGERNPHGQGAAIRRHGTDVVMQVHQGIGELEHGRGIGRLQGQDSFRFQCQRLRVHGI